MARLDLSNHDANMYGCLPCPECGSRYRAPYKRQTYQIECGDCGYIEGYDPDAEDEVKP